jgi:hypothetical protein
MGCFFSRKLNGDAKGRVNYIGKAFVCLLPEYRNPDKPEYIICGGDLDVCALKHATVSKSLDIYWNSPEREHHELMRHWAKAENGKK